MSVLEIPTVPEHERALLGSVLEAPRVWSRVRAKVLEEHFAIGAHQLVWRVVTELAEAGQEHGAIPVLSELTRRGELERVGGAPALFGLVQQAGAAAPEWLAERIRHAADARQLIRIGQRLAQSASELAADPDEMRDAAARLLLEGEVLVDSPELDEPPRDMYSWEQFWQRRPPQEIPWLVRELLMPRDVLFVLGGEGSGKALAVDTPILSDRGWLRMDELKPGDSVFTPEGGLTEIRATTAVMTGRPCYRVRFNDGTILIADASHEWETQDYNERSKGLPPQVRTTRQLAMSLRARDGFCVNHSVELPAPLKYPPAVLPITPYVLGAWLGDGTSVSGGFCCAEPELIKRIERDGYVVSRQPASKYGWTIRGIRPILRELGVLGNKRIPELYLRASLTQRTALLQGLMDTDGSVEDGHGHGRGHGSSRAEITLTKADLVRDVVELIRSLGYAPRVAESRASLNGRDIGPRWRIAFRARKETFALRRKRQRVVALRTQRTKRRFITAVEAVESVPVRCIEVADPRGMFLAGSELIPTHNSFLSRQFCLCLSAGVHPLRPAMTTPKLRTLLCDLENDEDMLAAESWRIGAKVNDIAPLDHDMARVWPYPQGINLRKRADQLLFERHVAEARPQLVAMGSLFQAYERGGDDWDTANDEVKNYLNRVRMRYGFALIVEHHMPAGTYGKRELRPYGGSTWQKWPSLGYVLHQIGDNAWEFGSYRDSRLTRDIPPGFHRTGELPWTPIWDKTELHSVSWAGKREESRRAKQRRDPHGDL